MAEEIGVGYVRLIPSMRGFKKAAERELKGALKEPARKAGEDAGDTAGKEMAKGGKPSGKLFGKDFAKGVKSGLVVMGDPTTGIWMGPGPATDSGEKSGKGFSTGFRNALGASALGKRFVSVFSDESESGIRARSSGFARKILSGFGKELGVTAKPTAITAATAFSSQFIGALLAGLASGVGKIAHGLGSVLALLPAAAATGVLAFGTLKVAVLGVGDALEAGLSGDTEKFRESLKSLSPAAREFARDVVGLKGGLDSLRATVQENFFVGFSGQVTKLAGVYLPMLRSVMADVAGSFGDAVGEAAGFLRTPATVLQVRAALVNMATTIGNVARGLSGLVAAFLPLVHVGSTFLPGLSAGFEGATSRLAVFMQHAADTGKLASFIQGGLDKLHALWETAKQVGRIFLDLVGIGNKLFSGATLSGGHLLDTIESGVDGLNRFFETARGSSVLAEIMETGRAVIGTLMGTLQRLGEMLGRAFGPVLPQILDFIEAFANLKSAVLDTALDALEPVLAGLGAVLGGVVLPALTGLANFLSDNQQVLQAIGIAILTMLVPAFVAWAVSAGAAAVATIAATWPILAIGAAVAALAYLVIHNWDTIKKATAAVFSWIGDHWEILLAVLTGGISLAVGWIISHWDMIQDAIGAVLSWIGDHWGMLLSFLSLPLAIFVGVVVTQWEHIRAFIGTVFGFIAAVASAVLGAIGRVVAFVAGVVIGYWRAIGNAAVGAWNTIWAKTAFIRDAIVGAVTWVRDKITGAFDSVRDHVVGVWDSIKNAIAGVVEWIANKVDTVKGWISDIGDAVSSIPGAGIVKDVGGFLGFDVGGVVPGPLGAPMLAVVHGGETVVPTHDAGAMRGFAADPQFTSAQRAALSSSRAVAPAPQRIVFDLGNGTDDLVKVIRKWIANNSTGDVQVALGR